MISKNLLNKKINTTRTRKFNIENSKRIKSKLSLAQLVTTIYFNYGLKYLYQHFGVSHLNATFPSSIRRKYLINTIVKFARNKSASHTDKADLKSMKFNMQSIDKMLESLCVNFIIYRHNQYKRLHYWSKKDKKHYLRTHRCNLTGYGRINYKHNLDDIKSFTFKQNHNRIHLINNYMLHVPYFGNIQTKQSLTYLKHQKLVEVRVKVRRPNDYELQTITKLRNQKHLSRTQGNKIQGMDVNSESDNFFDISDGTRISWPLNIKLRYKYNDYKARQLQHYITNHNYGNDNSRKTRHVKHVLHKLKAKTTYMIDNWQLHVIHKLTKTYPVLAMEQLTTFTMRISKRDKRYHLRKNTNHKLATIHPTRFRKWMEIIYQDTKHLLLEVNPAYTSKTCHNDGYVNFNLKLQKLWKCHRCKKLIHRDLNSTFNIKDWSVNPKEHTLWKLHQKYPKKFPNVTLRNLVIAF